MIVAHCFLREIKKGQWYMMCETTATSGTEPPFPSPEVLFKVDPFDKTERGEWAERAARRIAADRPDLEFLHVLKAKRPEKGRPPAFDLAFRPRKENNA